MSFDCLEVALQIIPSLAGPVRTIAQHDRDLAGQLKRAATSIASNVDEGRKRLGGDRAYLWSVAAGSAAEVATQLRIALGWGYVDADAIAAPLALLDRVRAMLWRLTH